VNLKTGLLTGFGQGLEEILPVHVIEENGFLAIAPAQDVVNGPRILDAHQSGHGASVSKLSTNVNGNVQKYGLTPKEKWRFLGFTLSAVANCLGKARGVGYMTIG
jgi:hypothetical protein